MKSDAFASRRQRDEHGQETITHSTCSIRYVLDVFVKRGQFMVIVEMRRGAMWYAAPCALLHRV